ncbi:phosphoglucosamine mutase [Mesotoga sp. HF07.pep.5.2.highcov]|jgi:phosphoglucosamine mutase|uniref:phosphoglucosamine mutase n=1 Tax=Mesotoga TaxID=1184396 RepID=UPI0002C91A7B|nr:MULTISPECIES: phosphoglucosamine mutase [Mesotoga]MCP5457347.1 phosphoglucosamine mutase [Thermotogota bacterium]CCU83540.1 Phosphoglucosamine mutase [Mesotoga infera]MCP5460713.1 phosphoglucosamine mutase [Thermotogota bacterium]RLL91074.1 phosphoglucosamine mutase [Mesotoga sp. HF07.pep.5.2.highcov]HNQ71673.1 phosphoglucosamine mutase [Mesotoga prima]
MKKLFGTDGIRGVINEELTPELAMKLGNAIGRYYTGKYNRFIIAKDTRSSGDLLESAMAAGAASAGMNVEFAGVIPTPALAYITNKEGTLGAVISASHNPAVYNGIKVLARGMKISDEDEVEIENLIIDTPFHYTVYSGVGKISYKDHYRDEYIDYVIGLYRNERLPSDGIVVDGANGAISTVISMVYESLGIGAELREIEPNGININDKCGSLFPNFLGDSLKKGQIGVLFDGDADRCLFVLPGSKLIDGDMLMALNSRKLVNQGRLKGNRVVATVMSNLGFEKYLTSKNISLDRTKVGDKYVLERMLQTGGVLGGEQSGHIIFLDRSTTGDGLITSLETLNSLEELDESLEEFAASFPVYPQLLKNVPVSNKKLVMEDMNLKNRLEELKQNDDLRIVLRPSGTEPYIRVMVEGAEQLLVEEICQELVELVQECSNG